MTRDVMDAPETEVYTVSEEALKRLCHDVESRMTPDQIDRANLAIRQITFGLVDGAN